MKIAAIFCSILLACLVIISCQKELDYDLLNGPSFGTLSKDSVDCLPSSVSGDYITDSALTADNFIDLQVTVTTPGWYVISSDTINGFSFRDSGTFAATGLATVRLKGSGVPGIAGTTPFAIRYGLSSCVVDVEVVAAGVDAIFTFGGAGGTCTGTTFNGLYMEGLATTSSNTATVDVQVTSLGNYSISTVATNGVTFSANGTFTSLSQDSVILTAQGTPAAAGTFNYALLGNGSSCAFEVTFDNPASAGVFSLGGSPGNCTGFVLNGSFTVGTPLTPGNTAVIDITVTTTGTYSITTNTVNGINFSASGLLNATGPQSISLIGSGTPLQDGSFNYTVTAGGSECSFNVTLSTNTADSISCNIDGGPTTSFNVGAFAELDNNSTPKYFGVGGANSTSGTEQILLTISKNDGAPITPGTYDVNGTVGTLDLLCTYTDAAGATWRAQTTANAQTPPFSITIATITTGSNPRVTGTFTGPMKDNAGAGPGQVLVTNGTFDVALQ